MADSDIAISVSGLSKTYRIYPSNGSRLKEALDPRRRCYHREFHAVQNVDFEVLRGETVGIVGRNGSGKSTLLKMLAGVLSATAGRVVVHGEVSALLELGTGFNPELSGIENIYMAGTLRGLSRREMSRRVEAIVEFAEIGDFIHQKIKTYSSGMYSRLAFAVAVNVDPDILIIDEALSVGDAAFRRKCFARMEEFRKARKTILFVSHSESAIIEMCNRAILMDAGEKLMEGSPKQVVSSYLRLINSKGEDYKRLRLEIKAGTDLEKLRPGPSTKVALMQGEQFIDGFVSKSKVEYEEQGAQISNVRIETLQGEKVNRLMHGRRYRYAYDVLFLEAGHFVSFGMMIKTLKGVQICGGSYPHRNRLLPSVGAGEMISVSWEFDCLLEEGSYFTNCGVRAMQDGEQKYLHRILDAYMFQVAPRTERITTSYVNLGLTATIIPATS